MKAHRLASEEKKRGRSAEGKTTPRSSSRHILLDSTFSGIPAVFLFAIKNV
jgi:hypothetical protein